MGKNSELSLEEQLKQGVLEPGQAMVFRQNIELQFQDGIVEGLKEQSKNFILTESEGSNSERPHLMVTVEGIHTGMTKNQTFYPGNVLEESVPSWTTPHGKPVIKNHNISTEPLGRIVQSEYVESTLVDKYTVRLKLKITDQDAIEKILDGRYLTLSVGGSANKVVCSVCAKDLVTEGWCGHSRGRAYEGKKAHWTIGNYTGDEISFVNQPADVFSQVIAAELVTSEGGKDMGNTKPKEQDQGQDTGTVTTTESEAGLIDNLLGEPSTTQEGVNTDNDNQDTKDEPVSTTENTDPETPPESTTQETLEENVTRLTTELAEMTAQRDTAQSENVTLIAEKDQVSQQLADMTQHKEAAESERDTFKTQNLTLARFARRSMAERVVDLRVLQGKEAKDADRETLVTEWVGSSSKVLESTIKDLLENSKRTIATVPNPAIVENDKNAILVDNEDNEIQTQESSTPESPVVLKTFKDLSDGMTTYLTRDF